MGISLKMGDKARFSLSVVNILLNKETLLLNGTAESKNPSKFGEVQGVLFVY